MTCCNLRKGWTPFVLAAALFGCWQLVGAGDEEPVRKAFTDFQAAIEARAAGKMWDLLDSESRKAAERAAKQVKSVYAGAPAEKKARLETALGLPGATLAALTGEGFLKTKGFHGKYHEVPGSKIAQVSVQGNRATVTYIEEDGDKEKLRFSRQDGKWKVTAPMPPVVQP